MLHVFLGHFINGSCQPFGARIKDCPRAGLAALDFRRDNGLPDDTDRNVLLPGLFFADEALVREFPAFADDEANLCMTAHPWTFEDGKNRYLTIYTDKVSIPAPLIRDYLSAQNATTGAALARWLLQSQRAYDKALAQKEVEKSAARVLLADELAELQSQLEKANEKAN